MYQRVAKKRLDKLAEQYPAILILGARQVGKTTLSKLSFPVMPYIDLEDPNTAELFNDDAKFQLQNIGANTSKFSGVVLDEAQNIPTLFQVLRGVIDENRNQNGKYIILGSSQPTLVRAVSESLAGRVGIVELDPLTSQEVIDYHPWQELWLKGGFPDALDSDFREWHENYLRTYIERDLPMLGLDIDPIFSRRLLTMLAHQQGGLLNTSTLCNSLGVSHNKVKRYLDIFEQTFIIRRLQPYFKNIGKRLTKSPKIYIRDTGMLHHLLNISTIAELNSHPILGASWETFVIEELIRREKIINPSTQYFFWRTTVGAEVDLILQRGDQLFGVEIKSGIATAKQARSAANVAKDLDTCAMWIIDRGEDEAKLNSTVSRRGFDLDLGWVVS